MGYLIEVVGIDGSCKTTLCKNICNNIGLNKKILFKNGFGNLQFTNEIQKYLNQFDKNRYDIFSHKLINILYMMDLITNTKENIIPLLKTNHIICDRYITSAKVYSLATTDSDISNLFDIYEILPQPLIIIFLKIDPQLAYKRIINRNKPLTYYENPNNLAIIQNTYIKILQNANIPVIEIDASQDEKVVTKRAIDAILENNLLTQN